MTTTIKLVGDDDEGHQHVRAIEDAALAGLKSGKVRMEIDGQAVVLHTADTSYGHTQVHPTDAAQDKHHPHAGGRKMDAPVTATFLPA